MLEATQDLAVVKHKHHQEEETNGHDETEEDQEVGRDNSLQAVSIAALHYGGVPPSLAVHTVDINTSS